MVSCMSREVSREESLETDCQEVLPGPDLRELTRQLITPCREAHGHQGNTHQDVEGGEEDRDHILLPGLGIQGEPGDPDGGE